MNALLLPEEAIAKMERHISFTTMPRAKVLYVAADGSIKPSDRPEVELTPWLSSAGGCAGFIAEIRPGVFTLDPECLFLADVALGLLNQS
jgi:hypothetical protein